MLYYTNIGRTGFLDKNKIKEIEHKGLNIGPKPITGGLWCMRAGHADGWETYTHTHQMHQVLSLENAEISTKENARMLIIDSKDSLDHLFNYAIPNYHVNHEEFARRMVDETIWEKYPIDWAKVAQDYDVVEFRVDDYPDIVPILPTIDFDSALILNKAAIEDIINPPTYTLLRDIEELTVGEEKTAIEDNEYKDYTKLRIVNLPSTLQWIDAFPFSDDAPITQINYNGHNLAAPEFKQNDIELSEAFDIAKHMEPVQEPSQEDAFIICLTSRASQEPDIKQTIKIAEAIIQNLSKHDPDKWQEKTETLLHDMREYGYTFHEAPSLTLIEPISQLLAGTKTVQEIALSLHEQVGSDIQDNIKILENYLADDTHDQSLLTPIFQMQAVMQYQNMLPEGQKAQADDFMNFILTNDTMYADTYANWHGMDGITLIEAVNANQLSNNAIEHIIHSEQPIDSLIMELIQHNLHTAVKDIMKTIDDHQEVDAISSQYMVPSMINNLAYYLAKNIELNNQDIAMTRNIAHDESIQLLKSIIEQCYKADPYMDMFKYDGEMSDSTASLSKLMIDAGAPGLPHIPYPYDHTFPWQTKSNEKSYAEIQQTKAIEERVPNNIQMAAQLTQQLVNIVNNREAEITEEGDIIVAEPTREEIYEIIQDTIETHLQGYQHKDCIDALYNECVTQRNGAEGITYEMEPTATSQILLAALDVYADINIWNAIQQERYDRQYYYEDTVQDVEDRWYSHVIDMWMQPIYDITGHDLPSDDERDTRGIEYGDE